MGLFEKNSRDITVKDSSFRKNDIGIALESSFTSEILNNIFNSNELAGITIVGSFENKIAADKIDGSVNRIYLHENSEDNRINSNFVSNSRGVDLNNGNGIPISVTNNVFLNNSCSKSLPKGLGN
jgi:parallel beta-helix repeat protein